MAYIPRSSTQSGRGASAIPKIVKRKHTFRVFGFISSIMLLGAVISVAGALGYDFYIEQRLDDAKRELAEISSSETNLRDRMEKITTFHSQLSLAEYLIENHLAPSKLFTLLEQTTKSTVQYQGFTYTYDPGFQALLDLKAGTNKLASVALQNNQLSIGEALYTEYVLEGINNSVPLLGETAEASSDTNAPHPVSFRLSGELDMSMIAYTGDETSEIVSDALPIFDAEDVTDEDVAPAQTEGDGDAFTGEQEEVESLVE